MIRGYPQRASVLPGGTLVLHVATDAPRFRVRFVHYGDGFTEVARTAWQTGVDAFARGAGDDWQWPAYPFAIPAAWPSGVYIAHLDDGAPPPLDLALDRAAALFVVRGNGAAPVLYKLGLSTYHAYNYTGGGCFYRDPPRSIAPPGSRVSLLRPGGGIGGIVHGADDAYDAATPRSSFGHFDAPFIRWLTREGIAVDYCIDLDVHDDARVLAPYRLILSVGHDEYWSEPTRDAVEAFVSAGGNAAFFGANLCWWRTHVVAGGAALVCHQGGPRGALDHWWRATGADRPEDGLTGGSYRHGGGWWDGRREATAFRVQRPDHWAFAGTGLQGGEAFGAATYPPLVGYECDGAPLERFEPATGSATLARDARARATPAGLALLAVAPLGPAWQELPERENEAFGQGLHAATIHAFERGGTTFTAGTTDWPLVLERGDPVVGGITRNVLRRLAARPEA